MTRAQLRRWLAGHFGGVHARNASTFACRAFTRLTTGSDADCLAAVNALLRESSPTPADPH